MKLLQRVGSTSPTAPLTVICLPHAGGGTASFAQAMPALNGLADVWCALLPGRENRMLTPSVCTMKETVAALSEDLLKLDERPIVLLACSFGGWISHALIASMSLELSHKIRACVLCGSKPPHLPQDVSLSSLPSHMMLRATEARVGSVNDLNRLSATVIRSLVVALRNDLVVAESYRPAPQPLNFMHTLIYMGIHDLYAASYADRWVDLFPAMQPIRWFESGHFLFRSSSSALTLQLRSDLLSLL